MSIIRVYCYYSVDFCPQETVLEKRREEKGERCHDCYAG